MNETMPWYRSQIIVGALISVLSKVLVATGAVAEIAPDDEQQLASLVVLVLGGLGDIWAMRARVIQTRAPAITATKQ
jgi:hypothetical protein